MNDKFPHIVECYDLDTLNSDTTYVPPVERVKVENEQESQKAERELKERHPNGWIVHVPPH